MEIDKKLALLILSSCLITCIPSSRKHQINEDFPIVERSIIPEDAIHFVVENGRYIVPVTINDSVHTRLGLDNGVSNLILDSLFVSKNLKQLKLSFIPKVIMVMNFLSGTKKSQVSHDSLLIDIQSNKVIYKGFTASANMNNEFYRDQITGVIPIVEFGKDKIIYIDPKQKYLRLLDSLNASDFSSIPFRLNGSGAFLIKTEINIIARDSNFSIAGDILIDLGFPTSEIRFNLGRTDKINYPLVEELESSEKKNAPRSIQVLYSDSVQLRDFDNSILRNVRCTFITHSDQKDNYCGIIGIDVLKNFITVIDYKAGMIRFKKINSDLKENKIVSKWGITLTPFPKFLNSNDTSECKWFVTSLTKNSKADSVNIKLWDELVLLNNTPMNYPLNLGRKAINIATSFTIKHDNRLLTLE